MGLLRTVVVLLMTVASASATTSAMGGIGVLGVATVRRILTALGRLRGRRLSSEAISDFFVLQRHHHVCHTVGTVGVNEIRSHVSW